MSAGGSQGWSSRELDLADDVLPGPDLDAFFFNTQLTPAQRRSILQPHPSHKLATQDASEDEVMVQNVQEERIERVWETPGQAAVRTLLVLFDSTTATGRPRRKQQNAAVTSSKTRAWKHRGEGSGATGSTVTTTVSSIPNGAVVIGKSVTVPGEVSGSQTKAETRKKSFVAEAAFFQSVPRLLEHSVTVPEVYFSSADQSRGSFVFILEDMRRNFPKQHSGFTLQHAEVALEWLARFHAAFWEGRIPFGDTWDEGTFWNLSKRPIERGSNEKRHNNNEEQIRENWKTSIEKLALPAQVHGLCEQLLANASWLDAQLSAGGEDTAQEDEADREKKRQKLGEDGEEGERRAEEDTKEEARGSERRRGARVGKHRTLLHGDFKAENILFSLDDKSCTAVDFQWCGAGYPARDVMYLVCSASCDKVRVGAWEQLLRHYHATLEHQVCKLMAGGGGGGAEPGRSSKRASKDGWEWDYSWEVFEQHWRVAVCDFVRFCIADGVLIKDDFNDDTWLVQRAHECAQHLQLASSSASSLVS